MSGPRLPRTRPPRVALESPRPSVDRDRFAAKVSVDEPVEFSVDAFADGHDVVAAEALVLGPDGAQEVIPLTAAGNDRYVGWHTFASTGRHRWTVRGWIDRWSTWVQDTTKKVDAGLDVTVEAAMGASQLRDAATRAEDEGADDDATLLTQAADDLGSGDLGDWLAHDELDAAVHRHADREPVALLGYDVPLLVERERARFSSWYEFFPRSVVGDAEPPGTLVTAVDRLDHIADLGFDVVYLPPIHPIGTTARKGADNATTALAGDPGSPWAIGSGEGGHTAVHPELGTLDDLVALVAAAGERGLELALDIAFQCSPDHPWVSQHPQWFVQRPDGSIQYAENPPKKYQDIYPLNFESEDWKGLWKALRDVIAFWCERGVRIFRVDNPHTKAFAFWEWAIASIQDKYDGVIFLSEAFTRPRVMQRLAKVGFTQSYTYFPWRNTADELREYLTETSHETVDWFRPNSWPNTPDILTPHLQQGGRAASLQRAVLAATLTASYGVYGPPFELVETAARPGSEEYLGNEKYEIRSWELDQPQSLAPVLKLLNRSRRAHRALQWDRTLHFHRVEGDGILCYSKTWPGADGAPVDRMLMVVNVDPHHRHTGVVDLDLEALGVEPGCPLRLRDELGGSSYVWEHARNFVDLDPWGLTAHVFAVEPQPAP